MKRKEFVLLGAAAMMLMASSLACCFSIPIAERSVFPGWQSIRGSGDVVEETYEVQDFNSVALTTVGSLYIEQGEEEGLRIEAEDNIISNIEVEVNGTTLEIGTKANVNLRPTKPVRFYLTALELEAISLSGSGDIEAPGLTVADLSVTITGSGDANLPDLDGDAVSIKVSGSGDVDAEGLTANNLAVRVTGSGSVDTSGRVDRQEITISGSGNYEARDLESSEAEIRIGGSGVATVWASDSLDIKITGSGSVRYAGSPQVSSSVTGSGSLRQIAD